MYTNKSNNNIDSEQIIHIKYVARVKKLRLLAVLGSIIILGALASAYIIGEHDINKYGNALPIGFVTGNSMSPTMTNGEPVIYYTPAKALQAGVFGPGSIIIYQDPKKNEMIVHRVMSIYPNGSMITQGDNNPGTDQDLNITPGPVAWSQVYGVMARPLFGSASQLGIPSWALPAPALEAT